MSQQMPEAWTTEQDDREAFSEAMTDADISVRRLERQMGKLASKIDALYKADGRARDTFYGHTRASIAGISATLQTPKLSRWRQEHSEGRGKRHSQQHVLEVKLRVAKALLAEHGVDLDAELSKGRAGS